MQDNLLTETRTTTTTATASPRVAAPDQGEHLWFTGNSMRFKATAETTGGAYALIDARVTPGHAPPLHVHEHEDEAFFVLEGTFRFLCDGERTVAEPGTYLFVPRGTPHAFRYDDDEPGRMLSILSPGGGENFFRDAGEPAAHSGMPPAGPPDMAALLAAGERHGNRVVGPPMGAR